MWADRAPPRPNITAPTTRLTDTDVLTFLTICWVGCVGWLITSIRPQFKLAWRILLISNKVKKAQKYSFSLGLSSKLLIMFKSYGWTNFCISTSFPPLIDAYGFFRTVTNWALNHKCLLESQLTIMLKNTTTIWICDSTSKCKSFILSQLMILTASWVNTDNQHKGQKFAKMNEGYLRAAGDGGIINGELSCRDRR